MLDASRFLLVVSLLGCSKPASAEGAPSHAVPPVSLDTSAHAARYTARGVVRSIDADKSLLWIAHEDIPGYMKAMTMPFVASAQLRRDLHPGDRVEFAFHDEESGSLVIESLAKRP